MPPSRLAACPSDAGFTAPVDEAALALVAALGAAPLGLVVFDRSRRIVHVNGWLAEADGLPEADHVGRTLTELFPSSPGVVAPIEDRVGAVLESGQPATMTLIRAEPGAARREWVATYFPTRSAAGHVVGACGIILEVTGDREREAALVRCRLEAERAARHLAYQQELAVALGAATDAVAVAEAIVRRARPLVGAASATVRVVRDGALHLLATDGDFELRPRGAPVPLDADAPVARAARRREAVWLEDRAEIERRFPGLAGARREQAALVALPLTSGQRTLGALAFAFDRAERFDLEARARLLAFEAQCAQALDRALLHEAERAAREAAQRSSYRLARLQAVTAALSAASTVGQVAAVMVNAARSALGAHTAVAYLLEPGSDVLALAAAVGEVPASHLGRVLADAPTPGAHAARTGATSWLETPEALAAAFPRFVRMVPGAARFGALVAYPLRARGEVLGALGIAFEEPRRFMPEDRDLIASVADQCGQALDRARLLEDERRARQDADRARSLLDGILANAPIGIGFFDRALRFQRVNPKLAEMNGIPAEAHLGRTPRELFPDLQPAKVEQALHEVIATGQPVLDLEIVGAAEAGAGRRVWVESWYPVHDDGALAGVGALVREVTKEREAEEFQRHVLGVVGHDLRNPLSAIVTAVNLLARSSNHPPGHAHLLDRVARSAGRIDEIVRALLDFANVRAGHGVPMRRRPCDLAEVARGVAEECALAHPGREIQASGSGDCAGEWDPGRVAQLLANLVANALQYSPPSAPARLQWTGGLDDVLLEVANAGPPIPAELLPHIFEPFRRGDAQHRGGLGLGLFIARAIVEAHAGRIDVRSAAPDGTVVSVRLPRS